MLAHLAQNRTLTGRRAEALVATALRSGARIPRRPGPTPLLDGILAELKVPRPLPEDIARDPGYLALQLWGLSDLMRSAAAEDPLSPEAVFFVTAALDDVAVRINR